MRNDTELTLNLGCGEDVYGDVRLDFVPTGSANVVGDCQQLPFKDDSFVEVYERNVFEHLPNPGQHLFEVKRVLKEGGTLTLITDNASCLKYYLLGTHTGGYSKHQGKDKHFALFTKEHIKNFMELCSFRIVELSFIDSNYFTRFFDKVVRLFIPSLSYPRIMAKATKSTTFDA
jgi:ubiquinone/menaquinone biosynthesis C-methylase UbiE